MNTSSSNQRATATTSGWRVLKFGGSSVRDAARMRTVAELVSRARSRADNIAVVVSALGGTTDQLLELTINHDRPTVLAAIAARHLEAATDLADSRATDVVTELLNELNAFAASLPLAAAAVTLEQRDRLMSFGERLSAPLVAAALRTSGISAEACDMRGFVATSERFGAAEVNQQASFRALREHFSSSSAVQVATGFLGAAKDGRTTTLGRGGSDLTAALLGAALNATEIEIWTDVDGVLDADPRVVKNASSIPHLSYEEVMELAHFGAKVLYPPTVSPARTNNIPIRILNTLNPEFVGTVISNDSGSHEARPFTGITAMPTVSLLTLGGSGMLGVTGTAHRFFGALASVDCNVILISQASSEHSICAAIPPDHAERARAAIDHEFEMELRRGRVQPTEIEPDLSVIAVVGAGMREHPGIAARVFSVLGEHEVNVRAIAQGSSELNISVVVREDDRVCAVRALHAELFGNAPSNARSGGDGSTLEVVVAGVGGVGAQVLDMVHASGRLRLVGVIDSRHQLLASAAEEIGTDSAAPRSSESWRALLAAKADPNDSAALLRWLRARGPHCAFVDCTASASITDLYPGIAATGADIVAANKLGLTADRGSTSALAWSQSGHMSGPVGGPSRVGYEATVGAGLPVISTLRSMLDSGDTILEISGVFSGTLGYLLDHLRQGQKVSVAIKAAYDAGYTEPDPRDDLSGMDVARKLLILARTCGQPVDLADISLDPLVPLDTAASIEDFWATLSTADAPMLRRSQEASEAGDSIAYLASVRFPGGHRNCKEVELSVGLAQLPAQHPACQLSGTDNLFSFRTERYDAQPLIVRGPGAGTTVTAAGVLGDLLSLGAQRGTS